MQSISIKGNSVENIKAALKQAISETFVPTLAIVFMLVKQDSNAISALLHDWVYHWLMILYKRMAAVSVSAQPKEMAPHSTLNYQTIINR
jgi:hypothetical protein